MYLFPPDAHTDGQCPLPSAPFQEFDIPVNGNTFFDAPSNYLEMNEMNEASKKHSRAERVRRLGSLLIAVKMTPLLGLLYLSPKEDQAQRGPTEIQLLPQG